jgi:hypothetical protein
VGRVKFNPLALLIRFLYFGTLVYFKTAENQTKIYLDKSLEKCLHVYQLIKLGILLWLFLHHRTGSSIFPDFEKLLYSKTTILSWDSFKKFGRDERKNKERKEGRKIMYLAHIIHFKIVYTQFLTTGIFNKFWHFVAPILAPCF